jgi:hypothetical protein
VAPIAVFGTVFVSWVEEWVLGVGQRRDRETWGRQEGKALRPEIKSYTSSGDLQKGRRRRWGMKRNLYRYITRGDKWDGPGVGLCQEIWVGAERGSSLAVTLGSLLDSTRSPRVAHLPRCGIWDLEVTSKDLWECLGFGICLEARDGQGEGGRGESREAGRKPVSLFNTDMDSRFSFALLRTKSTKS